MNLLIVALLLLSPITYVLEEGGVEGVIYITSVELEQVGITFSVKDEVPVDVPD